MPFAVGKPTISINSPSPGHWTDAGLQPCKHRRFLPPAKSSPDDINHPSWGLVVVYADRLPILATSHSAVSQWQCGDARCWMQTFHLLLVVIAVPPHLTHTVLHNGFRNASHECSRLEQPQRTSQEYSTATRVLSQLCIRSRCTHVRCDDIEGAQPFRHVEVPACLLSL